MAQRLIAARAKLVTPCLMALAGLFAKEIEEGCQRLPEKKQGKQTERDPAPVRVEDVVEIVHMSVPLCIAGRESGGADPARQVTSLSTDYLRKDTKKPTRL